MSRLCQLFVALLALAQIGATVTIAQDATPDTEAACTVEPRSAEDLLALWYEPSGTPVAPPPTAVQVAEEADFPPGEPADAATIAAIDAVARTWVACANAGDLLREFALFTDDLVQQRGFQAFAPREEAQAMLAGPAPLPPEFAFVIRPARQVRIFPDGRAGAAFIVEQRAIGAQNVYFVFAQRDGHWRLDEVFFDVAMTPRAQVWGYRIVAEYPHDPEAFTQGLVFNGGDLYEGTGIEGRSTLRRVDLETGEVLQSRALAPEHWGEGIAIVGDRVYQLTWLTQTCFVYDRETFAVLETFTYPTPGWGLTADGERLVMSDGSNRLVVRDPETFAALDSVDVWDGDVPVSRLNELEYVDGEVWANVWHTDRIVRIDPATGDVTGWIELTGLLPPDDPRAEDIDVLNGIAYDGESGRVFVTGKLWPSLFEIEVIPPQ